MNNGVKEWEDRRWWLDPNYTGVIRQLEQRKSNPNLILEVNGVRVGQNHLSIFLANDGAQNKTGLLMIIRQL